MKTGLFAFAGIELPINVVSMKEIKGLMPEQEFNTLTERVLSMGGFWASNLTEEHLKEALRIFKGRVTEEFEAGIASATLGATICCVSEIAERLTSEEVHAVLKHEEGHVKLGHLQRTGTVVDGMMCDEQNELEADAYAAETFGKEAMRSALLKVIQLQSQACSLGDKSKSQQEWFQVLVSDSIIQKRLVALG